MDIKNLDLNLLKVFDAVYRSRNLTRAAREMSLSQPAISYSLGKLREFFKDPLVVREGNVMMPTSRAEALNKDVKAALSLIRDILDHGGGTPPSQSSRTFVVGTSDYCHLTLMPDLLCQLSQKAPAMTVRTLRCTMAQRIAGLEDGSLDLVLAGVGGAKPNLKTQTLFTDDEVCIVGPNSPVDCDEMRLEDLGQYPSIRYQMSPMEKIHPFHQLDSRKIQLKIRAITDQELMVPMLVARTGSIGIVGRRLALSFQKQLKLRILPLVGMETRFMVRQYWHPRQDRDPVHTWFRNLMQKTAVDRYGELPSDSE